ncbi:MAG: hypothetical protein LAO55_16075 [Acidobacteriia bacterium]|nr:hypothetical protein [Terriglobia bacterium]
MLMPLRRYLLLGISVAFAGGLFAQQTDDSLATLTYQLRGLRTLGLPTSEFLNAAEVRAAALGRLIETDPRLALASALPEEEAAAIRQWGPALAETVGGWEGSMEVRVEDDFVNGTTRNHYLLGLDGEEVEVFPADRPPISTCLPVVRVTGLRLGARIAASDVTVQSSLSSCTTSGVQNIAVILVNFASTPLPANITSAFVQNAFFGASRSMDTYWRETSYNRMSATGQVFGPFTIADMSCASTSVIRSAAIAAADPTVNFTNFSRIFIIHPAAGSCSIGVGTVGCATLSSADGTFIASTAWMRADYLQTTDNVISVGVHEGGHNMGLEHSSTMDYGSIALGPPGVAGTFNEYWDLFSAMGLSFNLSGTILIGHYPAVQKATLGWLQSGTEYQTVTSNGTYTLIPYETSAVGLKALRVQRPGTNKWLWIEYRQPLGSFDSSLGIYSGNLYSGALIHYEDPNDINAGQTLLLDFTPTATPNNFADSPLLAGHSWTDPNSTLMISVVSATSAGLIVTVTTTAAVSPCDLNADGVVNVVDVQLSANKALGSSACGNGDLDGNGVCNVVDLQRLVIAALGGTCHVGP